MRQTILAVFVFAFALLGWPREASTQVCYNNYDRQTYTSGFSASDFSSTTAVQFQSGDVLLNVGIQPLNIEQIVLPFDQNVRVKYVYRNAAASHTLGWFYLDQLGNFLDASGLLKDVDLDGIKDFFQTAKTSSNPKRLYDGLWHIRSWQSLPDLVTGPSYSDANSDDYPHLPALLERSMLLGGGMIFKLCDDDVDLATWGNYAPVGDSSATDNGIPDYDVNADGTVGNEVDRMLDLGLIEGNREIVFFLATYYSSQLRRAGLGLATNPGTKVDARIIPWFTKRMLNPDFSGMAANALLQKTAIGCARDDAACYQARGATLGWMDQAAIDRLHTATYNNLALDDTVVEIRTDANRYAPHFVSAAPHSDPNRWLLAADDQPEYKVVTGGDSCSDCTSDADFNDVVFLIERTNGGEAVSTGMSSEIPPDDLANTTISKLHISWQPLLPAPCSSPPNSRIDLYYSVDNGSVWRLVTFPEGSPNEVVIDLIAAGISGNQLKWRAIFTTDTDGCQPTIEGLNLGYEALRHAEYFMGEPIPVANTLFRGLFETPSASWTITGGDRSTRGHLQMVQLYDPDTGAETSTVLWDAGEKLAGTSPNSRHIYYNRAGTVRAFSSASAPTIYQDILPTTVRSAKVSGRLVYDLNGDNKVDDNDALFIVNWTRGFESGNTQRAWKLGAIYTSSPAIIGPPSHPWWIDGAATPPNERDAYNAFVTANVNRPTFAVVGAQDGMLHAFAAGAYRWGDDPSTDTSETRGYFVKQGNNRNYGDGAELWAYIPASLVGLIRNNLPAVQSYNPGQSPHAAMDGALTISDLYLGGQIKSVAVAADGRPIPFLSALDVTIATQPQVLWASDWSDADYYGTYASLSVGPTQTSTGRKFVIATSSGVADHLIDVYLFLVDAATGVTNSKIMLTGTGGSATKTYGSVGSPVMIDLDEDGMIDRVYVADTLGRIYKVVTATSQACLIASLGESVYSPIAMTTNGANPSIVRIFVAGGDNPDVNDAVGDYHFFGLQDDDQGATCSSATVLFSSPLPAGPPKQKVWSAPTVSGDTVYFATSVSNRLDPCDVDPTEHSQIVGFSTTGDGTGGAVVTFSPVELSGNAVAGVRAYDNHLLVNTIPGGTTVLGGITWNNAPVGGGGTAPSASNMTTTSWYEQ